MVSIVVDEAEWTRTVYFDYLGREEDVKPVYVGLGLFTDFFEGIDFDGHQIDLMPGTDIGKGIEYGSPEYEAFEEIVRRYQFEKMIDRVGFPWPSIRRVAMVALGLWFLAKARRRRARL